jgi:hypothetical protein
VETYSKKLIKNSNKTRFQVVCCLERVKTPKVGTNNGERNVGSGKHFCEGPSKAIL